MYFLTDEACSPLTLTEKEYSWMLGQLRAKRSAELKKAILVCFVEKPPVEILVKV